MNVTYTTALVLEAIAAGYHYGFDAMDATGLPSGTVYPALRRLEDEGLVRSRWERAALAHDEGRPPRRYYEISASGERWLVEARTRFRLLAAALPRKLKPARAEG
jgi:DNA-binding PadR family transcriptional regulator